MGEEPWQGVWRNRRSFDAQFEVNCTTEPEPPDEKTGTTDKFDLKIIVQLFFSRSRALRG